ncbi:hypothetical protein GQ651_14095 [Alphaproteobacteria bacterium GH1-50]|uniref:Uncharacterized protein n=1 Tax=Kangsaoukella pontilimi TaxID=2691042 RepID=A0A7C9IH96_9RHOB|nr:hypothetical protein [Kangsaoukella pontilimi]MXQ08977.1 hypothetical protein [Kangsaoukella pontilimi]
MEWDQKSRPGADASRDAQDSSRGGGATENKIARLTPAGDDPRLVTLVRLLARQAARDFIEAENRRHARARLHD